MKKEATFRNSERNLNITVPSTCAEEFAKQSNEFTSNLIRTVGTNNQMTINTQAAARENVEIYNRTVDAITEFSTNVVRAWTSWYAAQQQQFFSLNNNPTFFSGNAF
ncbi:MAG: hypothetical protein M3275_02445 [Thermoproteota archaeon]|nr:hypothetical protein [Thermoproteota archaeon]